MTTHRVDLRLDVSSIPEELYDLLLVEFRRQLTAAGYDQNQYIVEEWLLQAVATKD